MVPTSPSQLNPAVQEIHAQWIKALLLPPTPRRTLLKQICAQATASNILSPLELSRLYLDLSLTNAYLGEYHNAALAVERALNCEETHRAFALFVHGLAKAELEFWPEATNSWKRCLRCFGESKNQKKYIPYHPFQEIVPKTDDKNNDDDYATTRNIGIGEVWLLEHCKVRWNLHIASMHTRKGSIYLGIQPLNPGKRRFGLNGIPAGLRFGPDRPLKAEKKKDHAKTFPPLTDIGKRIPSRSSPQSSDPSPFSKSLPPLPPPPRAKKQTASVRPRGSKVWFSASPEQLPVQESPTQVDSILQTSPPWLYDSPSSLDHYSISSHDEQPLRSSTSLLRKTISSSSNDRFQYDDGRRVSPRTDSSITEATTLYDHPLYAKFDPHEHMLEHQDEESENSPTRPNYHIVSETLSAMDSTTRDLDEAISSWNSQLIAQESPQSPPQSPTASPTPSSPSPRYYILSTFDASPILTPSHHPDHRLSNPGYIEPTTNTTHTDNDNTNRDSNNTNNDETTLECLQPRTFEGFGPRQ